MTSRTLNYILIACSILFFALFVTTVFVYANLQKFVNQQIEEQSPLTKGSDTLEKWSKPSDDTLFLFSFYFFNITNPEEVLKGEKPILSETGPYRFNEKRIYDILSWDENEELLNFKYKKNFFYDSDNFQNTDDKITTLNVPLITTYNIVKMMKLSPLIKWSIITLLNRLPLITTQKATDLLFGGYKDNLTRFIAEIEQILKYVKIDIKLPPSISSSGQFALMANRNDTDYGLWTIFTGKNHLDKLGKMLYLDGKDNIPCWASKCNRLMGSDGLLHKPFVKNDDVLSVFELELNRTVDLVYEKDSTYEGLPAKKFVLSNMTYASQHVFPENKCFYPTLDPFNDMSGILYTQHCNLNVPLAFSNPHFYLADKYFLNQFDGLNPIKSIHESFVYVSTDLGVTFKGRQAVQLNIDTNSVPSKRGLKRFVFPIFWIDESGFASKTLIDHINDKLYSKVDRTKVYLVFGSFFLFVLFVTPLNYVIIELIFKWRRNGNDTESIISNETDQNNSENEATGDSSDEEKKIPDIKNNDSAISV